MVWLEAESRFIELPVQSVEDLGSNVYRVLLNGEPLEMFTGLRVSPFIARHALISAAIEAYFDSLGPGDLFDIAVDRRGERCVRFVPIEDEFHYRAGSVLANEVSEALGSTSADTVLAAISKTVPSYPSNLVLGPNMLTAGKASVFSV
jgi:hypothetical protein